MHFCRRLISVPDCRTGPGNKKINISTIKASVYISVSVLVLVLVLVSESIKLSIKGKTALQPKQRGFFYL